MQDQDVQGRSVSSGPWLSEAVRAELEGAAIPVPTNAESKLDVYAELLGRWNVFSGLMSQNELRRVPEHIVDAISLAPYLGGATRWLDIGSGGGFPAIPLKILLPDLPLVLVERNGKKAGFLRKILGALRMECTELVQGDFPGAVERRVFSHITARAVEKPLQVLRSSLPFLEEGAEFLWQSGEISLPMADMFHVEHVDDLWKTRGWRRGTLDLIRLG